LGLALLVPLVDRFAPRHVLSTQFSALAIALAVNAVVGTTWLLGLVIGVVGAGSSVGAQLSSVAGRFANPRRRATVLGIVTAGILAGRIVGGWLNDEIGWRGMFLVFAIACAIVGASAFFVLPGAAGSVTSGYLASPRRLPVLYLRCAPLRLAAGGGTLWFFAFCAVWAGLGVALSQPPFSYSSQRIGQGRRTQSARGRTCRRSDRAATLGACLSNAALTLACLGLFDAGLFAAQVANQSTVLAIDPAAPAQFNSAYMLVYFVGGTLGTAFGAAAVGWFGWPATTAIAACAIALAMIVTATVRGKTRSLG
jgi:predicted MFS family arabinose efflux permease